MEVTTTSLFAQKQKSIYCTKANRFAAMYNPFNIGIMRNTARVA